jgi:cytochrome c-type biogenesis protein CcmH
VRKLAWGALVLVVAGALFVGVTDRDQVSDADRAHRLGETIMCPACNGETVTNSQVSVAKAIRRQIAELIDEGKTNDEIRDTLVDSFGERIVLNPPRSGLAGLVWALPVAGLVIAGAALFVVFRRWRAAPETEVSEADVEAAARARQAEDA